MQLGTAKDEVGEPMAKQSRLKVYRTPIGFHDAFVAASSRKAALAAWGSDKDLFARGVADVVDDPALTAEPLATPGKIIRRLRGTTAEQIAALPADTPKPRKPGEAQGELPVLSARPAARPKPRKVEPKPSREALDAAERALEAAKHDHEDRRRELAEREAALVRERQALDAKADAAATKLSLARDQAAQAYDAAVKRWQG